MELSVASAEDILDGGRPLIDQFPFTEKPYVIHMRCVCCTFASASAQYASFIRTYQIAIEHSLGTCRYVVPLMARKFYVSEWHSFELTRVMHSQTAILCQLGAITKNGYLAKSIQRSISNLWSTDVAIDDLQNICDKCCACISISSTKTTQLRYD